MIQELDLVVLTRSIKEHGLQFGDVGTVVHCYADHQAYEVEFIDGDGETLAVLTLNASDIRLQVSGEILHVREVAPNPM
ncbi:MAG: DUF4926 domain-containing protein [Gemmatimonadetes bacterium]|nr:DUF4926 domain-containing protein [Rhodothermaceae bacterium]MYK41081.1 DUF4926 domain-containing protein [Gemmatimonadota bacterium]